MDLTPSLIRQLGKVTQGDQLFFANTYIVFDLYVLLLWHFQKMPSHLGFVWVKMGDTKAQ